MGACSSKSQASAVAEPISVKTPTAANLGLCLRDFETGAEEPQSSHPCCAKRRQATGSSSVPLATAAAAALDHSLRDETPEVSESGEYDEARCTHVSTPTTVSPPWSNRNSALSASSSSSAEAVAQYAELGVVAAPIVEIEGVAATMAVARRLLPGAALTKWQEEWCTPETVAIYVRARQGNPEKAGEILAKALLWRQRYKDVLIEARQPKWTGDLRVVARGEEGHPIVYMCMRNSPKFSEKVPAIMEHAAAVFEAAVRQMRKGATQLDVVVDCHGFSVLSALNPGLLLEFLEMLKDPYRDRLRSVWVVDASASIDVLWRVASRVLPEVTLRKVRWVSKANAEAELQRTAGLTATESVLQAMAANREKAPVDAKKLRFPTEVPPGAEL